MTRSEQRLAELRAITDRALTPEEHREAVRMARNVRNNDYKRELYWSDPEHRQKMIRRAVDAEKAKRRRDRQLWEESRRQRGLA